MRLFPVEKMTPPPHILLIYQKLIPSVRLCGHSQLESLSARGVVKYRAVPSSRLRASDILWADLVFLGRLDGRQECGLVRLIHRSGKPMVYILDDDLLNIAPGLASSAYYGQPDIQSNIRDMMAMSDAILSPSPLLLEKYAQHRRRAIRIEEPVLSIAGYRPHDPAAPVRIGFAGSVDRTGDIEDLLREALMQIKREYRDRVAFEFFGPIPDFAGALEAACLPYTDSYDEYHRVLLARDWDIGLAPMPDTPFHACKHYNKFLEYAGAGIAGIYSNVPPYTRLAQFPGCCLMCENTPQAWVRALRRLIDDPARREALRKTAAETAARFGIDACADAMWAQVEPIAAGARRRAIPGPRVRQRAVNAILRAEDRPAASASEAFQPDMLPRYLLEGILSVDGREVPDAREDLDGADAPADAEAPPSADAQRRVEALEMAVYALRGLNRNLSQRCARAERDYEIVTSAALWRIGAPLRRVLDALKRQVERVPGLDINLRTLKWALSLGPMAARERRRAYRARQALLRPPYWPAREELERQRDAAFPRDIRFSILVPLYNTPRRFLREMIESVLRQSYPRWELCLADGSDADHGDVEALYRRFARRDARVQYRRLVGNLGISGNTNACIDMASGDYFVLLDHDDVLHPSALFEVMKAVCDRGADFIYTDENTFRRHPADAYNPRYKPDFAPDSLRANNYICHLTAFSRDLLDKVGRFRPECDGSQDYDMVLRLTERAERIVHIPKVLYYWRAHAKSTAEDAAAKPDADPSAKRAIADHLERVGLQGEVLGTAVPSIYRIRYAIQGAPLVSILIPNRDHAEDLRRCIDSVRERSSYTNYEIIIIENGSRSAGTFDCYGELTRRDPRVRVVEWTGAFNYAAINNFGFRNARGEYILLLNNDTEVISPDWIQEMLMFAQRPDVGAVGAKLCYPDHTIQHAGVGLGLLSLAGHYHRHFDGNHPGYMGRLSYAQNVSAVTAACAMFPRRVFEAAAGLDERFAVTLNDVDLCLRIREAGYLVVWTPFAELFHRESGTRGADDTPEKQRRFALEVHRFMRRWHRSLEAGDPYYNPNLTLKSEDFAEKRCTDGEDVE